MLIQLLLTGGLVACVFYSFSQQDRSRLLSPAMNLFVLLGLYFVWMPEHANDLAHAVGVGRGADLVLYCWIVLSLLMALNLHLIGRSNLRLITELARQMALADPLRPTEHLTVAPPPSARQGARRAQR